MLSFINSLFRRPSFLSISPKECPNCWGHQQWNGQYCTKHANWDDPAGKNSRQRNGFIRRFVQERLRG